MKSLWDDSAAAVFTGPLGPRVYSSRLLGSDPSLVLHGGGNTSFKCRERGLVGDDEDLLYVKGSGSDLSEIEASGFTPLRLAPLLRLAALESLSDPDMVNELLCARTRADAPTPSVETLLHAALPFPYIDHTHADAVVAVSNSPRGAHRIAEIYGSDVVVVRYVMPGFDLAREAIRRFQEGGGGVIGMVLLSHGVFSFGSTARQAYERMIDLVSRAEDYLRSQGAWDVSPRDTAASPRPSREAIATVRRDLSREAGAPFVVTSRRDPASLAFARRTDLARVAQQGPATPDHIIRTKRVPLLGRDVAGYATNYRAEFEARVAPEPAKVMLDPAPRIVLDPELGLLAAGRSPKDARIASEIYEHTIGIIERAERLGGWQALSVPELFAFEYWDLEQAKLRRRGPSAPLSGEVALVTGAAQGIGRACLEVLAQRGAAVIGLDIDPLVERTAAAVGGLGVACDVTDPAAVDAALNVAVDLFGGVDILILNAGRFPGSSPIAEIEADDWTRTMALNVDANVSLLRQCHGLLALSPEGGRVVGVGSKNVAAPGRGAAAYSASKAAFQQLLRVAALEWAKEGIRVNLVHPHAVFDTALWTPDLLASRAAAYGLTADQYRRSNLLGVEVRSKDVAEVVAELCGSRFSRTTGGQIPVDGGLERVV
jgi:rhamnose utilization protein RhaD (predicted bifunctional aldolase and dehydrogenase)/NAD(P)-dependent dehydrogenase (short-subunit alcohol dehydrogenase family)